LKYWRGYIITAFLVTVTTALMAFSKAHGVLVDMIYPYVTRLIQTSMAGWVSGAEFCLWQLIVVLLGVLFLASVVLMLILRWNFVQWLGWVLASASLIFCLHTGVYGLNTYAGDLCDDIRLNQTKYTTSELAETATYFRDIANELSTQVPRNEDGTPNYPSFKELAEMAANGFDHLVYDKNYSVFAGSTLPVKELGWADMYTSMGITGIHMPLTAEAAVNPQIPAVTLPFVMCHEMSHRMCISIERDANMGAFLACDANDNVIFRYSGYFMAFRVCYNALLSEGTSSAKAAAAAIYDGATKELQQDLAFYKQFFASNRDQAASQLANSANDAYIKISGDESGTKSYNEVTDLLVSWYIQEIYLPAHKDEEVVFDPLDKDQVENSEYVGGGA